MVGDFEYINARLRAMRSYRSYLLKNEEYEQIIQKNDFKWFFYIYQTIPHIAII